jgi:hypothetical protein
LSFFHIFALQTTKKTVKINYLIAFLFIAFVSIVVIANIDDITLIGGTELNGNGCVCHTTERDTSVHVWVEGPDTLLVGQTGFYRMYMTGGPAEAGGYNVAGRFGEMVLVDSFSVKHPLAPNELTQAFSLPFPSVNDPDTIYWAFGYTASDTSAAWDTIYSCGLSLVWDSIPDPLDRWNFGPKFPVKIETLTDVDDNLNAKDFQLYQNYPNPFNPTTKIKFIIPITLSGVEGSPVSLEIYDMLGNEIATLINEEKSPGNYEVEFSADGLPSGIYFYKLDVGVYSETKKMLLIK